MADGDQYTRVLFTDVLGLAHGKVVPTDRLDEPFHTAITVLTQGLDLSLVEVPGFGVDVGYPDLEAVADPTSVRPGWDGAAVAMASLRYPADQRPIPLDGRGVPEEPSTVYGGILDGFHWVDFSGLADTPFRMSLNPVNTQIVSGGEAMSFNITAELPPGTTGAPAFVAEWDGSPAPGGVEAERPSLQRLFVYLTEEEGA